MTSLGILKAADEIQEMYGIPADPEEVCREEKILLLHEPMGTADTSCKGFILQYHGVTAVTINSEISEEMQKAVLYHELAHYFLHIRTGLSEAIHDSAVYDRISLSELEANMLAAEMQLSDSSVLETLSECNDFFEAASLLGVPAELLDFKMRMMKRKGLPVPDAPLDSDSGYLAGCRG